ncbi:hypothetical protein L195_g010435 [Trifolium pratense]|nr:hypothetical protein L195_g010435 [Trifolium pratense]
MTRRRWSLYQKSSSLRRHSARHEPECASVVFFGPSTCARVLSVVEVMGSSYENSSSLQCYFLLEVGFPEGCPCLDLLDEIKLFAECFVIHLLFERLIGTTRWFSHFHWDNCFCPVYHSERSPPGCGMRSCVIGLEHVFKLLDPFLFVLIQSSP